MLWVLVFGGIALAGLVMLACFAVWLWHRAADLATEVGVLGERAAQLGSLLEQVAADPPTEGRRTSAAGGPATYDGRRRRTDGVHRATRTGKEAPP